VNEAFIISQEDEDIIRTEVLAHGNDALKQKDYWLEIRGNLEGDFHLRWYPKLGLNDICEVTVTKHPDIKIEFRCTDNFVFHAYLRWGKGAGFSNLRFDLRVGPAKKPRKPRVQNSQVINL
jgi:hypothetical protein